MEEVVKERRLLVDFENVQKIDLSTLPEGFRVTIFVGSSQVNLPFDLVQAAHSLGSRLEWLKVEGRGPNALDFHIAYYLGCLLTRCPQRECSILSRDSGFDPLVRHLKKQGLCCRRINSLLELEAPPQAAQPEVVFEANYKRAIELLKKLAKTARPRRRKTLMQHISNMFQNDKKLSEAEVAALIDLLFAEGKVVEANQTLSYTF